MKIVLGQTTCLTSTPSWSPLVSHRTHLSSSIKPPSFVIQRKSLSLPIQQDPEGPRQHPPPLLPFFSIQFFRGEKSELPLWVFLVGSIICLVTIERQLQKSKLRKDSSISRSMEGGKKFPFFGFGFLLLMLSVLGLR